MGIIHHLFISINNQLLFITNEEELRIVIDNVLLWNTATETTASLETLSRYYSFDGYNCWNVSSLAIINFTTKFLDSEFSQTCSVPSPLSFLLSIEVYTLTNPHSIHSPHLPILLKRFQTLIATMNTYSLIFHSLVFVCLFIQIRQVNESDRLLFLFKHAMMLNPTAVMQFVLQ